MATDNLLNHPGTYGTARYPYSWIVLRALDSDVLIVQQMGTVAGVTQFRDQVLHPVTAPPRRSAPFNDGPDSDNALLAPAETPVPGKACGVNIVEPGTVVVTPPPLHRR